jgi:RNA polymerase sigma-70 factor, ECF subfamily
MTPTADERFTRIYETHYPSVLGYCARRVNRSEAEDVANEVFVVLWRHLESFDDDEPLPWLYRVAYGVIRNRWKGMRRRTRLIRRVGSLLDASGEGPDTVVVRREQDRAVIAALESLRPRDREILRLSTWEELSAREIAAVVGCSVSAAEQRLHRARKRLANALSPSRLGFNPSPRPSPKRGGAS